MFLLNGWLETTTVQQPLLSGFNNSCFLFLYYSYLLNFVECNLK